MIFLLYTGTSALIIYIYIYIYIYISNIQWTKKYSAVMYYTFLCSHLSNNIVYNFSFICILYDFESKNAACGDLLVGTCGPSWKMSVTFLKVVGC